MNLSSPSSILRRGSPRAETSPTSIDRVDERAPNIAGPAAGDPITVCLARENDASMAWVGGTRWVGDV